MAASFLSKENNTPYVVYLDKSWKILEMTPKISIGVWRMGLKYTVLFHRHVMKWLNNKLRKEKLNPCGKGIK